LNLKIAEGEEGRGEDDNVIAGDVELLEAREGADDGRDAREMIV
jgi:hypothetical protein